MENNKEETAKAITPVVGDLFVAVVIGVVIIGTLFLWSPVSHYLGEWSDYWDSKELDAVSFSPSFSSEDQADWDRK